MQRQYYICEVLPSGAAERVATVTGLEVAQRRLQALAKHTSNECFAMDAKTRQIVAQMNVPRAKWRAIKRIFQIAYDEELGLQIAELLRSFGYGVVSVLGGERAKILLSTIQDYDLFIVGHNAPEQVRTEVVDWLKSKYPNVKVLALNPPQEELPNADFNVTLNGPDKWLPIVTEQ
jgi:CheY-like chemotaxis protein